MIYAVATLSFVAGILLVCFALSNYMGWIVDKKIGKGFEFVWMAIGVVMFMFGIGMVVGGIFLFGGNWR